MHACAHGIQTSGIVHTVRHVQVAMAFRRRATRSIQRRTSFVRHRRARRSCWLVNCVKSCSVVVQSGA